MTGKVKRVCVRFTADQYERYAALQCHAARCSWTGIIHDALRAFEHACAKRMPDPLCFVIKNRGARASGKQERSATAEKATQPAKVKTLAKKVRRAVNRKIV